MVKKHTPSLHTQVKPEEPYKLSLTFRPKILAWPCIVSFVATGGLSTIFGLLGYNGYPGFGVKYFEPLILPLSFSFLLIFLSGTVISQFQRKFQNKTTIEFSYGFTVVGLACLIFQILTLIYFFNT